MNVSLTPQLEALIHQKVETGLYNDASEVVREALRYLTSEADADFASEAGRRDVRSKLWAIIVNTSRG